MDTRKYLEGKSFDGYEFFGPQKAKSGYIIRLLAPKAKRVYIKGDFCEQKDELRGYSTGVFSITEKKAKAGDSYSFIIEGEEGEKVKIDPFAKAFEGSCSKIVASSYKFKNRKPKRSDCLNIYEIHLGDLLKEGEGFKSLKSIEKDLINHLKENNFTDVKFLPLNEYKDYESKGFPPVNLFSLSKRYGELDDLKEFIDLLHGENIGAIVDLDFSEFDPDHSGLINFDGSHLYDSTYEDIRFNYFGSGNFDITKKPCRSYILSAAEYRLKEVNFDGISLTSINNLIYRQGDKSRGFNENRLKFLRELSGLVHKNKAILIGNYYGYQADIKRNLPIDYIFDSSFTNVVRYFQERPYMRQEKRGALDIFLNTYYKNYIFGFSYLDSQRDGVSLYQKMWSNREKLPQYKALFTYLYTLNSKKMIYMGDEFALKEMPAEIDFAALKLNSENQEFNEYFKELTKLTTNEKAFYSKDSKIEVLDIEGYSTFAYVRSYKKSKFLVVLNLTDISYNLVAPYDLTEILNSCDLKSKRKLSKGDKLGLKAFSAMIFSI